MVKNTSSDGPPANKPKSGAITVQQINDDRLTQVNTQSGSRHTHLTSELIAGPFNAKRFQVVWSLGFELDETLITSYYRLIYLWYSHIFV